MTDPAAAPAPLRVLLVDPDDRTRESLAGLLRIGRRCLIVGSAGTADGALRLAREDPPDVVVVDPRLPGTDDGAAFITKVRDVAPAARILGLIWSDTADRAWGADAYLRKTFRSHDLIDAVIATAHPSVA
jgi:DNA-binding NarL/FixJ family response regulator